MLKKTVVALAVLLALAVGVGLAAPSFIDWNRYRGEIARQVEAATGRPLALEGQVELALLPSPRLRALGVSLPSPPGASTREMLRVREFEMLLNWGALLQGRLEVASLRLVEPELWFEVLPDGRNAWMLPVARLGAGEALSVEGISLRAARIEHVRVTGGRVFYRNARTGAAESFERIDGEMSADSLDGPARASGVATVRGQQVRFDLSLGDFGQARPVPVALTLNTDATTRASYRGTLTRGEGNARIQGRLQAEAASLAALLAAFAVPVDGFDGALAAAIARRVTINGQMTLGGDGLAAQDVAVELGDLRAGAAATIAFAATPAIDVALAVGHVDLDRLEAEHARARPARPRAGAPVALALPRGFDANLDLSIETLTVAQSVIRQAKLNAALNRGNLVITNGAAELPGGTALAAFGQVGADGRLDGVVEVNATNLRALLAWLGLDPAGVPPQRLRRLEAAARIEGTLAQPEIAAIDARFDGARLTGGVAIGRGARPAFGVDLSLDQLNLDAYRMPGASSLGVLALPIWTGFDANLRLGLDRLVVGGETLEALTLDGTLRAGTLDLRALDLGQLADAAASARGRVLGLGRAPELDLDWTVKSANAQRLLALFGFDSAATGALAATGKLGGPPGGRLRLTDLELALGDARARGMAQLDMAAEPPHWQARLEAESLDLDALARAEEPVGGRAAPRPTTPSPWPSTPLDLARLTRGQGEIALAARRLTLLGQTVGEARLEAAIGGGALDLRALSGAVHGGQLTLSGRLEGGGQGLRARGTLSGGRLESLLAGALGVALSGASDITFDLSTSGNDAGALARALSGRVALAARAARIDGFDLPGVVRRLEDPQNAPDLAGLAAIATGGGATPIDVVTGTFTFERGIARSDDVSLIARESQAQLRGALDIGRWLTDLKLTIELGRAVDAPGVAIAITGPIDQPRIEPEIGELSEYLARRAGTLGTTDPGAR